MSGIYTVCLGLWVYVYVCAYVIRLKCDSQLPIISQRARWIFSQHLAAAVLRGSTTSCLLYKPSDYKAHRARVCVSIFRQTFQKHSKYYRFFSPPFDAFSFIWTREVVGNVWGQWWALASSQMVCNIETTRACEARGSEREREREISPPQNSAVSWR